MNFIEKLNQIKVEDIISDVVQYVEKFFSQIPGEEKKQIATRISLIAAKKAYDLLDTQFKFNSVIDNYIKEILLPSLVDKLIDVIVLKSNEENKTNNNDEVIMKDSE